VFKNAKIGTRLIAGFAVMLAISLVLSAAWLVQSRRLTKALEEAVNATAKKQQLAGEIRASSAEMLVSENGIVLGSVLQRGEVVKRSKEAFRTQFTQMKRAVAEFRPLSDSSAASSLDRLDTQLAVAGEAHEQMMHALDKQQFDVVQKTFDDIVQPRLREISAQADVLVQQEGARLGQAGTTARSEASQAYWLNAIFVLMALGAGGIVSLVLHHINTSLRTLASQIGSGAGRVAGAATQVCSTSQSLAQCSSEQAAALEETSASMEQMSSVTHRNRDNSKSMVSMMEESETVVESAERTVRELSISMQDITKSGEKITKVVKIIDNIAFQTKILSLNAAVEAARAGAAGAGFAIVAEQVGRLAEECAEAAHSTAQMIDDTVSRVREGGAKLGRTAEAIQSVVQFSGRIKSLVDAVNMGSEEQARGIDQVSNAVIQMRQMTQQTAGNAQETASAGQELDSYAEALNRIVRELDRLVGAHEEDLANSAAEPSTPRLRPPQPANPQYSVPTDEDWPKRELMNIGDA
jgi:methyl-accepting chemotaxis protein